MSDNLKFTVTVDGPWVIMGGRLFLKGRDLEPVPADAFEMWPQYAEILAQSELLPAVVGSEIRKTMYACIGDMVDAHFDGRKPVTN